MSDAIAKLDHTGPSIFQERLMKNFTFIAAAALAIGLGFGASAPASAVISKCDNPNMASCVAECQANGGANCYRACCIG